jgi:beta-glucanase (GH16 family)
VVGRTADNLPVRSRRRLPVLALTTLLPLLLAIASATSATSVQQGRAMSPTVVTAPIAPVAPTPVGVAGSWAMKFSDEFNGTALNTTTWQPGWFGSGITPPVNSAEKQCFDARQATVSGGALHLALVARALTCGGVKRSYASGMVTSNPDALGAGNGYQFTGGVVEYRVFIPSDAAGRCANWPAVWSNGQNWPTTGEIDTYECLSSSASWHLHSDLAGQASDGPGANVVGAYTGWHTFSSNWQPRSVTFYFDGKAVGSHAFTVPSPHYLIMNNASASTTPLPADMLVDYVRVWQH